MFTFFFGNFGAHPIIYPQLSEIIDNGLNINMIYDRSLWREKTSLLLLLLLLLLSEVIVEWNIPKHLYLVV